MAAAADEERPLLNHVPSTLDVGSQYTSDGSVDTNGEPALKHKTGNWGACFLILGIECCDGIANSAIGKNLVTYLTMVLHESKVTAASNVAAWHGTCFIIPLIGSFLADTYWGRYWTIVAFLPLYIIGMLILAVSASFLPFSISSNMGNVNNAVVYLGLYLTAIGSGGIKPCMSTFGADQFDSSDPAELSKKGSFFNWYFFIGNISSLLSSTVIVWLQDNIGWGVGFAIPTGLLIFGFFVFTTGSRVYRFRKVEVSPLTSLCQVVVAAVRKWNLQLPEDKSLLYKAPISPKATEGSHNIKHTDKFRFLDKAAIILPPSDKECKAPMSSWWLCTVTQVEEMKMLLRMFPVWASLVIFYAVLGQMSSTFVEQAMSMDNHVGPFAIPPASLSFFSLLSIIIFVPMYETMLVPFVRRFTGREKGLSQTQRIGIGLALSMLNMVYAALVEMKRLAIVQASGRNEAVQMSILWLAPAYFVNGAAEIFAHVGMTEFFYEQAPVKMKSMCAALGQLAIASGSYLNMFIFSIVAMTTTFGGRPGWIPDNLNEGHLDYFFWMMAVLSLLNLAQFVHCSVRYREKANC